MIPEPDEIIRKAKRRFEVFGIYYNFAPKIVPEDEPIECVECDLLDEFIDTCIDNKINGIFIEPLTLDLKELRNEIACEDFEGHLNDRFNNEFARLSKIYTYISEENYLNLLESSIAEWNMRSNELFRKLQNRDGDIIAYRYKAFQRNKCYQYSPYEYLAEFEIRRDFYELFSDIDEELVTRLDMKVSLSELVIR